MPLNDPKDVQQRQSLTGVTSSLPPNLPIQGSPGTVTMEELKQVPMDPATAGAKARELAMQDSAPRPIKRSKPRPAPIAPQPEPQETADEFAAAPPAMAPEGSAPPAPPMDMVTTQVSTSSEQIDPKLKEKVEAQIDAERNLSEKRADLLEAESVMKAEQARLQMERANKEAAEAEAANMRVQDYMQRQQNAIEEYKQKYDQYASQDIQNPWSRASTGSKVLAGLSIVLGGLSGPGGVEAAQKGIDKYLADDLALQKANLDKKKGELTMIQQHAKDLRQAGFDDLQITQSMQAMMNGALAKKFNAMAAQMQTTDPAKAAQLAQMAADRAAKETELVSKVAENQKQTVTQVPMASLMGKAEKKDRAPTKLAEKAMNSQRGYEASVKLKKMIEQNPDMLKQIGPIAGRIAELKAKFVGDENAAVLSQSIKNEILNKLKAVTGAQMTDAERRYIAETMPSMFEAEETFMAKLSANIDQYARDYENDYGFLSGQGYYMGGFKPPEEILSWTPDSAKKR